MDDVERGWIVMNEKERKRLIALKEAGSKKEVNRHANKIDFDHYRLDLIKSNAETKHSLFLDCFNVLDVMMVELFSPQ